MAARWPLATTPPVLQAAWAVAACLMAATPAAAAPQDVLLSAMPERLGESGHLEASTSRVNRRINFSEPEDDPRLAAAAANGDYRSTQIAGAWQVRDGTWLSGALWQRQISDGIDTFRYQGWQLSGLVRVNEPEGLVPAVALRLSAWGNQADVTETTTPVRVPGAILDSVAIARPSDRQWQLDLIGTWAAAPTLDITGVIGAGQVQLGYGDLSATTTRNGCRYNLSFNGNDIFGTLAEPCTGTGGGVIQQFFDSSGEYGVDVAKEIAWGGTFLQAGLNASWRQGPWTVRGGMLMHRIQRRAVDSIAEARGQRTFKGARLLALEASHQFHDHLTLLLRLEASDHLFMADLPVTYNSSTSSRFGGRFSQATLGLRASF